MCWIIEHQELGRKDPKSIRDESRRACQISTVAATEQSKGKAQKVSVPCPKGHDLHRLFVSGHEDATLWVSSHALVSGQGIFKLVWGFLDS